MAPYFGRRPSKKEPGDGSAPTARRKSSVAVELTAEERHRLKQRTGDVADPILTAMREEQPFEVSAHVGDSTVPHNMTVRDIFGNVITDPDKSNPTRHRDERPLDTILTFEYAATGDRQIREKLFGERLPWDGQRFQPGYRHQVSETNSYAPSRYESDIRFKSENSQSGSAFGSQPRTPIKLGSLSDHEYAKYQDELQRGVNSKKSKRRGLFGRKKN
ncbi:hypothetical protein V1514DRAFT_5268 [Lipomyces japonicus]|uniref:uncharacterized protein n=1 Tax=Lipomyces japonicus TaxID=56871 RepID=UPI0034CE01FB